MKNPIRYLAVALFALLACLSSAQATNQLKAQLLAAQLPKGYLNTAVVGDSIGGGSGVPSYNQGVRLAVAAGLVAEGFSPVMVGDNTGNSGQESSLYEAYGGNLASHTLGGNTGRDIVLGRSSGGQTLRAFATAFPTFSADLVVVCLGTNGITLDDARDILNVIKANGNPVVAWIGAVPTASRALEYMGVNTTNRAYNTIIRQALKESAVRSVFVEPATAFGIFCRYPINGGAHQSTSITAGTDIITFAHDPGLFTAEEVEVAAATDELAVSTKFYVIRTTATTYKLATSRANALAGTAIDLVDTTPAPALIPTNAGHTNLIANAPASTDGTHPSVEGNAMLWAPAHAAIFGRTIPETCALLQQMPPFQPNDLSYANDISAAANETPIGQDLCRKKQLVSLTVNNPDASTSATITVTKIRYSADGSTVSRTIGAWTFKVPAGVTRGESYTFNASQIAAITGGGVAWYNERWNIAVAGVAVNVKASFKQTVF